MADLHGILAELGIELPYMHPEREVTLQSHWIVNQPFVAIEGMSFEVAYGKVRYRGEQKHLLKKIRIDGPAPIDWFDLDEGKPLDAELQAYVVRAFRPLGSEI